MVQSKLITTMEQQTKEHESEKSRYRLVPTTYYNPTRREYTSSGNLLLWIQQSKSLNCSADTSMHRATGTTWMPMHHVVSLYVVYSTTRVELRLQGSPFIPGSTNWVIAHQLKCIHVSLYSMFLHHHFSSTVHGMDNIVYRDIMEWPWEKCSRYAPSCSRFTRT
jgi:hypothetical protein